MLYWKDEVWLKIDKERRMKTILFLDNVTAHKNMDYEYGATFYLGPNTSCMF